MPTEEELRLECDQQRNFKHLANQKVVEERARAEAAESLNTRYLAALERIAHPDPNEAAFLDYNAAEEIAREALAPDGGTDG